MAELGDVSEGECSSAEEEHAPVRRRQDEELDGHEALAGGIVAVAQRVASKTSGRVSSIRRPQVVPATMVKCARFSEPADELGVESLIVPRTSAFASSSSSMEATAERTAYSPTTLGATGKPIARPIRSSTTTPGQKTIGAAALDTTAARAVVLAKPTTTLPVAQAAASDQMEPDTIDHSPTSLPKFTDPRTCTWTSSHAANSPSEDRSSSLVNVLLQPLPPNFDSETQLPPLETEYTSLVRLSLWSVIDGHGGGCVATYASEVLLPHIAASVSRALGCAIVDRGVCVVNGQLRDANALDLDGLITTSDRSIANPNSIHYRSPYEDSNSEEEGDVDVLSRVQDDDEVTQDSGAHQSQASTAGASIASSLLRSPARSPAEETAFDPSVSSVKTSVKTAASPAARDAPVGTHAPSEVAAVTRAITESFLAVDEGWINSIDPVATHQTSCQSNGRWNSGACALVVFTIQRLEWTSVSEADRERELRGPEKCRGHDTSQNKDAARRRMLDYATRAKSASSVSTISSTSSLTTAEDRVNTSGLESEITETEGEEDDHSTDGEKSRRRNPSRRETLPYRSIPKESLITAPGGCSCHCYRAYDALLYTAHVGDCRAVMLGSAPPRTIKVHGSSSTAHPDATDDESSHHSSDETECLSSSDHDADSSDDEEIVEADTASAKKAPSYMTYMRRPARRHSRRRADTGANGPFIALPPLEGFRSVEIEMDSDGDFRGTHRRSSGRAGAPSDSSSSSQESHDIPPAIILPPVTRPIDLTTDHSAYNPAEVTAVLRRCNNAPRAISAGVGGGIKRVAGSLAVTRALGDAYLKTPLLSFFPYKRHAPYITARPEVNCRPVVKDGDKVLILATDGVWERASGEDVLRWVRNFYSERIAEAERRKNRRLNSMNQADRGSNDGSVGGKQDDDSDERHELTETGNNSRKRENGNGNGNGGNKDPRSPSPPAKRRKLNTWGPGNNHRDGFFGTASHRGSTVADVILRRVLNKVRRARNISSLQALMSLPPGRARRSKHDDITVSVVDLSAFVS